MELYTHAPEGVDCCDLCLKMRRMKLRRMIVVCSFVFERAQVASCSWYRWLIWCMLVENRPADCCGVPFMRHNNKIFNNQSTKKNDSVINAELPATTGKSLIDTRCHKQISLCKVYFWDRTTRKLIVVLLASSDRQKSLTNNNRSMVNSQTKDLPIIDFASWWEALDQIENERTYTSGLWKMFYIHDVKKKWGKINRRSDKTD